MFSDYWQQIIFFKKIYIEMLILTEIIKSIFLWTADDTIVSFGPCGRLRPISIWLFWSQSYFQLNNIQETCGSGKESCKYHENATSPWLPKYLFKNGSSTKRSLDDVEFDHYKSLAHKRRRKDNDSTLPQEELSFLLMLQSLNWNAMWWKPGNVYAKL